MKPLVVALTMAATLIAIPGSAARAECATNRGMITGTLTSNGAPAEVDVRARREMDGLPVTDTARSDPVTGVYILCVLPATYKVEFLDTGPTDPDSTDLGVLHEWFDNKQTPDVAKRLTVTVGETVVADADLMPAAAIKVHVVDDATSAPVEGFEVRAYPDYDVFRGYIGGPDTDDDGLFRIGGLRTTNVRVLVFSKAETGYAFEWYDEGDDRADATPIEVAAGSETTITVRLNSGAGRIVGRVTDVVSGDPLDKVAIDLRGLSFLYAQTGSNGRYQLNGLRNGEYKLKFDGLARCSPEISWEACNYELLWHGGSPGPGRATPIPITSTDPVVINAELDVVRCKGVPATTVGTRADDDLSGSVIAGLGGDDLIRLGFGALVCAGAGNDRVTGSSQADRIYGGAGDDRINGGGGKDLIRGGPDDDQISGELGTDTLFGGPGDDRVIGGVGHDLMRAGPGDDVMVSLRGEETMFGGSGRDMALFFGPSHAVTVDLGQGTAFRNGFNKTLDSIEIVRATPQDDVLLGSDGPDEFIARGGDDVVDGGRGDDRIDAGKGNDIVEGGDGADVIWGRGGDDDLSGGPGADDVVRGGIGDDSLAGGPGIGDVCWGGAGVDITDDTCETVRGLQIA